MVDLKKALATGEYTYSDGAGAILTQEVVDKAIVQLIDHENPLRQNLPRRPGSGQGYICVRRTISGGDETDGVVGNTYISQWVDDTDTIVENTGTYARAQFLYKTIVAKGKVTRKLQATGRDYTDVLADELEARAFEYRLSEDWAYTEANLLDADAKAPLGLITQISSFPSQVVATAEGVEGGTGLTLTKLDELIDTCKGEPNMLIMSKKTRRIIQSMLQIYQRWVDRVEVNGGFKLLSYNGIPIYVSDSIRDNYDYNGTTIAGTTSTAENMTSVILAVNTNEAFVSELTPVSVMPCAKTTSQYDEFEIYSDQTVVLRDYMTASILLGVKAPA